MVVSEGDFKLFFCFYLVFSSDAFFRGDIATCIEAAFKRLSVKDAAQMLFFTKVDDVIPFAKQVRS